METTVHQQQRNLKVPVRQLWCMLIVVAVYTIMLSCEYSLITLCSLKDHILACKPLIIKSNRFTSKNNSTAQLTQTRFSKHRVGVYSQ